MLFHSPGNNTEFLSLPLNDRQGLGLEEGVSLLASRRMGWEFEVSSRPCEFLGLVKLREIL